MGKPRMRKSNGRWYCAAMVPRHDDGSMLCEISISGWGDTPEEAFRHFQNELWQYMERSLYGFGAWRKWRP